MRYAREGFYCSDCGEYVPESAASLGCPKCGSTKIIELTLEDLYDEDENEEEEEE